MRRYRIFADENFSAGDAIRLGETESSHVINVLRLPEGESVEIFNGRGQSGVAVIDEIASRRAVLKISEVFPENRGESRHSIILAFPFLKSDKVELVLSMATQMGASGFFFFDCRRSVPKISRQKFDKKKLRWEKILIDAVAVSGRSVLPEIKYTDSFQKCLDVLNENNCIFLFYEAGEGRLLSHCFTDNINEPGNVREEGSGMALVTGPEGGFDREEIAYAREQEVMICSLGKRILRAETAPVAAIASVLTLLGEI